MDLLRLEAARQAGRATADRIRIRRELDDLAELEEAMGETFGGAALRVAYAAAGLRQTTWRRVARRRP